MKKTRLRQLFEVVRYSGEKEELEEELSAVEKVIRVQRSVKNYDVKQIYEAMQKENAE
ncbi:MAG: hypothetical protein HFI07_03800 [Lachnospiraceae bacterium]|nr:hypothetical protein [Lachnospiraceae bacterium]